MKIILEDLTTAIQTILDNPTMDYPEIVTEIQNNFTAQGKDYNVDEILFLFLQALTLFWSNPLVNQWNADDGLIPYATARDRLISSGLTAEQIAEEIVKNIAEILMQAKLEPIYIMKSNNLIATISNPIVDEIYKTKNELERYKSTLQERYAEFGNLLQSVANKYNITDMSAFTKDIADILTANVSIQDYLSITETINTLQSKLDNLMDKL